MMAGLQKRNLSKIPAAVLVSLLDSTIVSISAYWPVYYLIQEFCHTHEFSPIKALQTTKENAFFDTITTMSFCCPLLLTNMLFVPVHLRNICITITSILWSVIVSKSRGRYNQEDTIGKSKFRKVDMFAVLRGQERSDA